jgi:ABC-2 type transport system ATP-binding protein
LAAIGLTKRYGETVAVDELSFAVEEGEIFGLLGPNGAGKTTTISIIATLLPPDGGSVTVGGRDVAKEPSEVRRLIGYVPQDVGLYLDFSARENLDYFGRIYGLWGRELRERIDEALEVVGLTDSAKKPRVKAFSGGMKRRLNLACGLLHRPKLLLLDEPTVGVDPQSRNHIFENIQRLNREERMTILYTTHYMEEAELLCKRVAIIDGGKLLVCDDVPKIVGSVSGIDLQVTVDELSPAFEAALACRPGIMEVNRSDGVAAYHVIADGQEHGLSAVLAASTEHKVTLTGLEIATPSLEQVFLRMTGKALRD